MCSSDLAEVRAFRDQGPLFFDPLCGWCYGIAPLIKAAAALPDVPTFRELGYADVMAEEWFGVFMPAGTPGEIVARMNRDTNATVLDAKTSKSLVDAGVTPEVLSPQELATLIKKDAETFRQVVIKAGIKPQPI